MSSTVEVFCDFDGTISTCDVTDRLLEELADPKWKEVEAEWEAGKIGSRECMAQQVALVKGGWKAMQRVLESVELESSFKPFVAWCRKQGVPLRIVSDGLDQVIYYLLNREGIKVDFIFANRLVESQDGKFSLLFPYSASEAICSSGVCKCKLLNDTGVHTNLSNPVKIVVGDGRSDFCWASAADLVFAKSKLLTHCKENKLPYVALKDFNGITSYIEEHILSAAPTQQIPAAAWANRQRYAEAM
jgi:2,3-diketo-5-methylthio-1-phosphopentane phosphatase